MRQKQNIDMAKYASLEQISTVLKCTPRWINRLVKEQGFPREGRGQYDLIKCVHWYIDYLKEQADNGDKSKAEYQAIREKWKALKEEINFKKNTVHTVISIDDYQDRLEKIVSFIITKLEIIPQKSSMRFANASATEIKKGMKELIDEIRDELSDCDKYGLQLDNDSGSTGKNKRGRKKSTKTAGTKKTSKTK